MTCRWYSVQRDQMVTSPQENAHGRKSLDPDHGASMFHSFEIQDVPSPQTKEVRVEDQLSKTFDQRGRPKVYVTKILSGKSVGVAEQIFTQRYLHNSSSVTVMEQHQNNSIFGESPQHEELCSNWNVENHCSKSNTQCM